MLPHFIAMDGAALTHVSAPVLAPVKKSISEFLPPYKPPYPLDLPMARLVRGNTSLRH